MNTAYVDAELYDRVFSWYDADLAFYLETARAARGPVLEVACGTGRVYLPTLAAGVDIDGIDLEPAMIEHLRRKAAARQLTPRVAVADMRDFTMPRRYALITIPFRAFLHLLTREDQGRALRCIRDHLEPGGSLVFNVFYPSFSYIHARTGQRVRERSFDFEGRTVDCYDVARHDIVNQRVSVEREVVESDAGGAELAIYRYGIELRWIFRFEMELLLRAARFSRWQVWGGFDRRPLAQESDEMVWTAWKD